VIIYHNGNALWMVFTALLVGFAATSLFGIANPHVALLVGGPVLVWIDMTYRRRVGGGRWFDHKAGGHMMLIPVWIIGVLWVALGALLVD
jgi:hypothetical protein